MGADNQLLREALNMADTTTPDPRSDESHPDYLAYRSELAQREASEARLADAPWGGALSGVEVSATGSVSGGGPGGVPVGGTIGSAGGATPAPGTVVTESVGGSGTARESGVRKTV